MKAMRSSGIRLRGNLSQARMSTFDFHFLFVSKLRTESTKFLVSRQLAGNLLLQSFVRCCSSLNSMMAANSSTSPIRIRSEKKHDHCQEPTQHDAKMWKAVVKRKVVMRIGYVGTNYKGLQIQRDLADLITIEDELERAILKAGGMITSNYGNLDKIGWQRSSRTDKGVHSLATVIAMKMEVPDDAWKQDPDGFSLADVINSHLPYNIQVFSILPINKGFDARRECIGRKYIYLLPAEFIGIHKDSNREEMEDHIRKFRDILKLFEGRHPFHNYTVRALYRTKVKKTSMKTLESEMTTDNGIIKNFKCVDGFHGNDKIASDAERMHVIPRAKWLYAPDAADKLSAAHFRKIISCTCSNLQVTQNIQYVEITIHGESFMFHQIRKMIGTAVAVKRSVLPYDIIPISLSRFSRVVLPLAPSEVLALYDNEFSVPIDSLRRDFSPNTLSTRQRISKLSHSTLVEARVHDFYSNVLLPELVKFLDPSIPLWKEWEEKIDQKCSIPDAEIDDVKKAWTMWSERRLARGEAASL